MVKKYNCLMGITSFYFSFFSTIHNPVYPQKPIISIITSVYKGATFIQGFLNDIVQQTIFDKCELILINAHSPDNEDLIIKKFIKKYPNIIYKRLDYDPGIYGVWNMAISMAQGEFITNANLDDRLKFDCYEAHVKALLDHPHIDLVYSDFLITYTPNQTFEKNSATKIRKVQNFSKQALILECLPNNHPMWRKSMHTKYGFFDETYKSAGDWEMWLRAVKYGAIFLKVPGIYGLFYYNPEGLSTNKHNSFINREVQKIYEKFKIKNSES